MLQISAELLSMSSDAAVLIKNGKIEFANTAAINMLGRSCVGQSLNKIFGDDIAAIQASSYIGEFPVNGSQHIIRVRSSEGVRAMFLSPSNEHQALISKAFIFSLRSCLMNIKLSLSLVREKAEMQPELRDKLAVISHECFKINRILSNISTIQDAMENEEFFSPRSMNLSSFISDIVDSVRLVLGSVQISYSGPESVSVMADPNLLELLLLNLISNCVSNAQNCSRISIRLSEGKDRVFLSVDDDGCGIPQDELHSVFDRYRHNRDICGMTRGAGIGLTAARAVAGLHDGTILLESRQDMGTAVRVSLSRSPQRSASLICEPQFYEKSMQNLLTGLSDCLPSEFFTDKYLE